MLAGGRQVTLLEPLVPAPLGEGVRWADPREALFLVCLSFCLCLLNSFRLATSGCDSVSWLRHSFPTCCCRASNTLSENVPAAVLRLSVEGPRAMLRQQQPAPSVTEEAGMPAGGAKLPTSTSMLAVGGINSSSGITDSAAAEARVGPVRRRRGLGRYLPAGGRP